MTTFSKHAQMGWSDYARGLPAPREYDGWHEVDQRNYENGRMRAANWQYAVQPKRVAPWSPSQEEYLSMIRGRGVAPAFFNPRDRERSIVPLQMIPKQHRKVEGAAA